MELLHNYPSIDAICNSIVSIVVALVAVFITVWSTNRANRKLKLLESIASARLELEELLMMISLATMPSPRLAGERFQKVGGWDALITKLNMFAATIDVVSIYGKKKLAKEAELVVSAARDFQKRVFDSIVDFEGTDQERQKEAIKYFSSVFSEKTNKYKDLRDQFLALKKFV